MRIPENNIKRTLKNIAKILFLFLIIVFTIQYAPRIYQKSYIFAVDLVLAKKIVLIGQTTVKVEVADTFEKRLQGLSQREELKKGTGMLFVFEKSGLYGIWMKDMNFAIDIIWFNQYREVIHIVEDATPESYPETFLPPTPSLYVLEVPTGFVKEKGIKLGDIIDFY